MIVIPHEIDSAVGPNFYSYTHVNTRRNIYRSHCLSSLLERHYLSKPYQEMGIQGSNLD